jgi:hypothetical protein
VKNKPSSELLLFEERVAVCRVLRARGDDPVSSIIYLVGLIVVVLAILSFLGLR